MRPIRPLAIVTALLLLAALAAPAVADEDPQFPTDVTVVGTQQPGTFGDSPEEAAVGHEAGADLKEARIHMPDAETVRFVIAMWNLPPTEGTPEFIRYTWDMFVSSEPGGEQVEAQLDGKFTNYTRGVCDPTAGCDPAAGDAQDPGMRPFFFRGNLEQLDLGALTFNAMEHLATIEADFDHWRGTITIDVPVEAINLLDGVEFGECSQIHPGMGLRDAVVETSLAVWLTSAAFPHDLIHRAFPPDDPVFTVPPASGDVADCFED